MPPEESSQKNAARSAGGQNAREGLKSRIFSRFAQTLTFSFFFAYGIR